MKNKISYIILAVLLLICIMIWNVVTGPGKKDLKGDFREVTFIRNEQNTGPIIRLYVITVKGEPWKEMEQFGNYMPHTKYGTTRIFFFPEDKPYPSKLVLGEKNFPEILEENCLAIYEKDAMGQIKFQKYPFIN